ncbi:hypothetical protein J3A83DRAFT_4229177 [Scleroderma citrinum]
MSFTDLKFRRKTKSGRSYVSSAQSMPPFPVTTSTFSPQTTTDAQSTVDIPTASASVPVVFLNENVPVSPDNMTQIEPTGLMVPLREITTVDATAPTSDRTVVPSYEDTNSRVTYENGMYKNLPSLVEIRECGRSGRGLWSKASTVIQPGSTILSVRPHVFSLSSPYLDSHCSGCVGSPGSGLKRCTRCRKVWYCNPTCQNNDWPIHKLECFSLQNWAASAPSDAVSVPSDAVRCLGRILWQIKRKGVNSIWVKEIQAMQSNRKIIQPSAVDAHAHLAQAVVRYLGLSSPTELEEYGIMSTADLVDLISRFVINTVALTSPSLTPIGVSVSPLVALINHSCTPNVVVVFPHDRKDSEKGMKVIALKDIMPGEGITMSYIDTTLPRGLRQKALTETYGFQCQCKACTEFTTVDTREAVWCPKSCGGTCSLPTEERRITRCTICGAALTDPDAVIDATRVGQEALDKAMNLQSRDHHKAKQLTTNIIPVVVSAGMTLSTHPLLALLKLHQMLLLSSFSSQLTQDTLDETIRTAGKYSAGLNAILDEGHPVRAVALAELGKLLAVDELSPTTTPSKNGPSFPPSGPARLKVAYETLLRARKELLIGFGRDTEGGEVGQSVRETIVQLEKELGVWTSGIRNALEDVSPPSAGLVERRAP